MRTLFILLLLTIFLNASNEKYEMGEKIYKETCLSCHGINGSANTGVSFVVNPRSLKMTILNEEQTYQIIKKGAHFHGAASDIMPAFESIYNETELRAVTHYVNEKFKSNSAERVNTLYSQSDEIPKLKKAKMLKRGKKIFNRNCSWCHGKTGQGDGEATRNPEMSIFPYSLKKTLLDKKQMFLYAKYGGKYWGTDKDDMPSWSRKYDDYTIKSVIKYIQIEFQGKKNVE